MCVVFFFVDPEEVRNERRLTETNENSKTVVKIGFDTRSDQKKAVNLFRTLTIYFKWRVSDLGMRNISFATSNNMINKVIPILLLSGKFEKIKSKVIKLVMILWADNQGPHTAVKCRLIDYSKRLYKSGKSKVYPVCVLFC